MRVTGAVREYVRKVVLEKVRDRLQKAELARGKAIDERDALVAKAREIAEEIAMKAQEAFVKRVAKLGLTWVSDSYNYNHKLDEKGGNYAFEVRVGQDDFAETMSSGCYAYEAVKSEERSRVEAVCKEPARIREVAGQAADKLLFELELGKVAKKELDEALRELEVKL